MKRLAAGLAVAAMALLLISCGSSKTTEPSGLHILGGGASGSPSPSASTSPTTGASASATPLSSPSAAATGVTTSADLKAYFDVIGPLYESIINGVGGNVSGVLVELSTRPGKTWDTAAAKIDGYAAQLESKAQGWTAITPPASLAAVHAEMTTGFGYERQSYQVIAQELRDRSYDPMNADSRVQALTDQAGRAYHDWRLAVIAEAKRLGVTIPFEFPE